MRLELKRLLPLRITSGIIILDESSQNKIFLEGYNGVCLRNFQMQQKLQMRFWPNF